jgi:hypothetical protein
MEFGKRTICQRIVQASAGVWLEEKLEMPCCPRRVVAIKDPQWAENCAREAVAIFVATLGKKWGYLRGF